MTLLIPFVILFGGGVAAFKWADRVWTDHLARRNKLPWWREPDDNFGEKS